MTDHTMNQEQTRLSQKQQAMQVWESASERNRLIPHPRYIARRRAEGNHLMKQVLGTLAVVGALMMMAKG